MENRKTFSLWQIGFFLIIFFIVFAFFTKAYLLVPYDGDDWANLSLMRNAVPVWKGYNPIKILPEDLFPLVGLIAAYVMYPILGDYIYSIAATSAFLFSLIICLYLYLFYRLVQSWFSLSDYASTLTTIIFFLMHFCLFYSKGKTSSYLLGTVNLTCLYHYVIPAIVNICVVLYLARFDFPYKKKRELSVVQGSILFLSLYLAIFSNALSNIILITYIVCVGLLQVFKDRNYWGNCKAFFKENRLYLGILIVWLLALFFEANGGRARDIGKGIFDLPVAETWHFFVAIVLQISKSAFIFGALLVCSSVYVSYKQKDRFYGKFGFIWFVASLISFVYLLLLCSKAEPAYFSRSDVFISFVIWSVLFICFSGAYLLEKYPKLVYLFPIFVLFFTVQASIGVGSFTDNTMGQINPKICYQIDNELIQQVQEADSDGKNEMILHVPKGDNKDNWPHPMYMGENLARTLYKHGLIYKPIKITIQPDPSINEKYHIKVQ